MMERNTGFLYSDNIDVMNEAESILETITDYLQKLEGAPAVVLVCLSGLVLGFILKRLKNFPNNGIPICVILWGGIVYPLIADANNDLTLRVWLIRNLMIGVITGFLTWLLHNKILKRYLDRMTSKNGTGPNPNAS